MHFVQIDIEGDVITIGMDDKSMEQHREKARHLAEGGDKSVTLHRVERSTLVTALVPYVSIVVYAYHFES